MRSPAAASSVSAVAAVVVVLLALVASTASAFVAPAAPSSPSASCRRRTPTAAAVVRMEAAAAANEQQKQKPIPPRATGNGLDRRGALSQAAAFPILAGALLSTGLRPVAPAAAAQAAAGPSFEETLSTLLLAKEVLAPVKRYIEIGQFDPARTNIKYVVNQFRIKKTMERAVLLAFEAGAADPGKVDEAAELTAVVDNELTQLDSSVYTQIFIPSEGELNPAAFKYRDQAFGFYDSVLKSLDAVLALASPADLAAADKMAGARKKQLLAEAPFLFKKFDGDFYRPATP